jgi:hypothetical protein
MAARETIEDRQSGMGVRIAIIRRHRPARRLAGEGKRPSEVLAPAEHGVEMVGERQVAERHRIGRIERYGLLEQPKRLGHVLPRKAADVPMRPHCAVPGVELAPILSLRVLNLGRDDAGGDRPGDALGDPSWTANTSASSRS